MTARPRGGRASARGAQNKIKAGNQALRIFDGKPIPREPVYPPKVRLLKLIELKQQCELAYHNTGSWTAMKKIALIEEHIRLTQAELALPSVW